MYVFFVLEYLLYGEYYILCGVFMGGFCGYICILYGYGVEYLV